MQRRGIYILNIPGNVIYYVEAYIWLSLAGQHKEVRQIRHYLKNKSLNVKKLFMKFLSMLISLRTVIVKLSPSYSLVVGINSTLLSLHIPYQTKHHSGYILYEASKCYRITFLWFYRMQLIYGGYR